jgi:hypothetical protein
MASPTFIVIGPGKTGTTWLYTCLVQHPDICMARNTKETLFFNENYHRGFDWYKRFFADCGEAKAIGEISNNYFFSEEVPGRIAHHLPDVRLICLLRHPLERLLSTFLWRRRTLPERASFEETISQRPTMVSNNYYDVFLERYLQHFPRERLFVGLHEDIRSSPDLLLRQIYEFIGVDSKFTPSTTHERVLPASVSRFGIDLYPVKRIAYWLRRVGLHGVLTWAKMNPVLTKILLKPVPESGKPAISPDTRERLMDNYRPHIERTGTMIGRDLSHWR